MTSTSFDPPTETLRTPRLDLLPLTLEVCESVLAGDREGAARRLGVDLGVWPREVERSAAFPAYIDALRSDPSVAAWLGRVIVLRERRLAIGSANLKGRPTPEGRVEVGYGLIDEHRGRGFAREAVAALLARAFADPAVDEAIAQIEPENTRSVRLVEALGFMPTGVASAQHEGHYVWVLTRERHEQRDRDGASR